MKFLLDMNVPRGLCNRLRSRGHECRHVGDIGMAKAADPAIVAEAKRSRECIVTHDLDFGHLLAFSGEALPSVIIFRLRNTHPDNLFARLVAAWAEIGQPVNEGAIVAIEDFSVRIRRLPLAKGKKES